MRRRRRRKQQRQRGFEVGSLLKIAYLGSGGASSASLHLCILATFAPFHHHTEFFFPPSQKKGEEERKSSSQQSKDC